MALPPNPSFSAQDYICNQKQKKTKTKNKHKKMYFVQNVEADIEPVVLHSHF